MYVLCWEMELQRENVMQGSKIIVIVLLC
jgi:hypothetical protein